MVQIRARAALGMKLLSRFCLSARRLPSKFINSPLKSSNLADLHFYYLPTASSLRGFSLLSYFCGTLCWRAWGFVSRGCMERIALRRLIKNFQLSQGGHLHTFAKRAMQISARSYYTSLLFNAHFKANSFLLKIHPAIIILHHP
jgi:hypothetical protein